MLLALFLACAGAPATPSDEGSAAPRCDTGADVTWQNFGEGFFTTYCQACHSATSPDRGGAPEGIDFDTPEEVRALRERVFVRVIEEGTMPVGGGIAEDDLALLAHYLDCGI